MSHGSRGRREGKKEGRARQLGSRRAEGTREKGAGDKSGKRKEERWRRRRRKESQLSSLADTEAGLQGCKMALQ